MTDSEFNELISRLHRHSGMDGDLGNEYWTRVIRQLQEMRTLVMHYEQNRLEKLTTKDDL